MALVQALSISTPLSTELYGFSGQSNSEGRGLEVPTLFARQGMLSKFDGGVWQPATEPMQSGSMTGHGVATGSALALLRPNTNIQVTGAGYGGSSMDQWARDLNPSSLYGAMLAKFQAARASGGVFKGFVWYQGESDAMTTLATAQAWGTKFNNMVDNIRSDMGLPNLPVVFVVLVNNPSLPAFPYWDAVVTAQQAVTLTGRNMARVSAQGLAVRTDSDDQKVHLSTAGQLALAQLIAPAMNALL